MTTDDALAVVWASSRAVMEARAALARAEDDREAAMVRAYHLGASGYAIGEAAGISKSNVYRVLAGRE